MTAKFKVGDHVRSGASGVTLVIVAVGPASYLYTTLTSPTLDFRITHQWADENCVLVPPPPKAVDKIEVWRDDFGLVYAHEGICCRQHVATVYSYDDGTVAYEKAAS